MGTINRKITAGVAWNLAGLLFSRGFSTILTLFLARLLSPDAFGLIAMMMIVMELAQHLVQSGLGQALIRSKNISDDDLDTIFYASLGLSALAYTALYVSAPWLANFYNQPELVKLLKVMGLVVFFSSLKVVPTAILSRQMNFRSQMMANTTSVFLAGTAALLLAWRGAGVWSLVVQSLVSAGITAFLLWCASTWKPRLAFSTDSFRRLFAFGANLLIAGTIRILVANSQVIVIGRMFSAEVTGLYFFAKKMSQLISQQLSGAVQAATLPAMAKLQDDNEQLRYKYRQIIQLVMFIISPVMALLAALAEPLFAVLLGDRWSGAVVYMQLLCIVAALYPLHSMNINVLNVKGRSDLVLKIGLFKNATSLIFLFSAMPYGVFWIVVGQVVNSFLSLIPNTYFTAQLIGYGVKQQVLDVAKPILAALVAGFTAYWISLSSMWPPVGVLILGSFTGMAVFLFVAAALGAEALNMLLLMRRLIVNKG